MSLWALELPNKTPSGTIEAQRPPVFKIRKNNDKNKSSVFFVLVTFNKSADTA